MEKKKKVIKEFDGFESLHDFGEELYWAIEHELDFPPEYQGKIVVTLEYIEDGDA